MNSNIYFQIKAVLPYVLFTILAILLSACGQELSDDAYTGGASIIVSAPTLNKPGLSSRGLDQANIPPEITAIQLRISQQDKVLFDADLMSFGDKEIEIKLESGVEYSGEGSAFAGEEQLFSGDFDIAALRPGEKRNVSIALAPSITVTITNAPDGMATASSVFQVSVTQTDGIVLNSNIEGLNDPTLRWYVNDVEGGNADVGTISVDGLYIPPAIVPSDNIVIVKAEPVVAPSFAVEQSIQIIPEQVVDTTPPVTTISPEGGLFNSTQQVSLSCDSCSQTFYRTSSSASFQLYSSPLSISTTTTVEFYSVDTAGNAEDVQQFTFFIDTQAPTTTASPPAGLYNTAQDVTLVCDDCSAIHYTTNGTTPSLSSPTYTSAIHVAVDTTIKFFAVDLAGNQEPVKSASYVIDTVAPVTTATPAAGTYNTAQDVALSCDSCNGIHYTTDGTTPTLSSATYSGAIQVTTDTIIKFFAIDQAGNQEPVKSASYVIDTVAPVTTATPPGGTYYEAQNVVLSCDSCSAIHYTTDGTTPSLASTTYSAPIALATNTQLRFFAIDAASNQETVKTEDYVFDIPATPSGLLALPGDSQVSLSWIPIPGGIFEIWKSTSPDAFNTGTSVASTSGTSYTVTGLQNGQLYYFAVVNVKVIGSTSYYSAPANTSMVPGVLLITLSFTDSALDTCVKNSATYIHDVTTLNCDNKGISDLSGIDQLTELQNLSLNNNSVADLSPLTGLANLTQLSLDNNNISNVIPLGSMTGLTDLSLASNALVDVTPLESLLSATNLDLSGNVDMVCTLAEIVDYAIDGIIDYTAGAVRYDVCAEVANTFTFDTGTLFGWTMEGLKLNDQPTIYSPNPIEFSWDDLSQYPITGNDAVDLNGSLAISTNNFVMPADMAALFVPGTDFWTVDLDTPDLTFEANWQAMTGVTLQARYGSGTGLIYVQVLLSATRLVDQTPVYLREINGGNPVFHQLFTTAGWTTINANQFGDISGYEINCVRLRIFGTQTSGALKLNFDEVGLL